MNFLTEKKALLILTAALFIVALIFSGCNPAKVGEPAGGAGDPAELKVRGTDSAGIPLLEPVGKPVVVMFTGNY